MAAYDLRQDLMVRQARRSPSVIPRYARNDGEPAVPTAETSPERQSSRRTDDRSPDGRLPGGQLRGRRIQRLQQLHDVALAEPVRALLRPDLALRQLALARRRGRRADRRRVVGPDLPRLAWAPPPIRPGRRA